MKMIRLVFCMACLLLQLLVFGQVGGNQGQSKKVAILDVVDKEGSVDKGNLFFIHSKLVDAVVRTPGYMAYGIDLAKETGSQDFQRTGLISGEDMRRIGVMRGMEYILQSECAKLGNGEMFITAKVIDVERGMIVGSASEVLGTTKEQVEDGCRKLVARLFGEAY